MTKYFIPLIVLLTVALSPRVLVGQTATADTLNLLVYNTGARLQLTQADFGGNITQDLIGTMARAFDTVMVFKPGARTDSTGKKWNDHQAERRADKISPDLKDKIVVMELNKDVDVTQTCMNIQRSGAKAIILIHTSNKKEDIKLKKLGIYKDDLSIPCFTVRNGVGDSLMTMLPSIAGIRAPTTTPPQALQSSLATLSNIEQPANKAKIAPNTPTSSPTETLQNSTFYEKTGWDISPNPARQDVTLRYNFATVAQLSIEVFNEAGQLVTNYILSSTQSSQSGTLTIDVAAWQSGSYTVRLTNGGVREVKRLVVVR